MRVAILCVLLSAVAISADLQSDLDDIVRHLPMEEMALIGQKYIAVDPSFREDLRDIQAVNYGKLYEMILKHKESRDFLNYLNQHGIDTEVVLFHLGNMMRAFHSKLREPQSPGQIKSAEPEISGDFLADCLGVISSSRVPAVIREKLERSSEFANLAAVVQDPEFKALLYRAINSVAFEDAADESDASEMRGFFSKVWKKIKEVGFGVGVTIPLGK